ncbi:MAG: hypothetical protein Q8M43_08960 [Sulfuricurvum sp.]|nr:hypothetical protein [Sulfuricurvum sp.]MDP3292148.1 hypothetical protein [Sulfuricurvum sp.]
MNCEIKIFGNMDFSIHIHLDQPFRKIVARWEQSPLTFNAQIMIKRDMKRSPA